MEVEGVHLPNVETEEGKFVHKKVDKKSEALNKMEEDEEKPKSVRSLTLTDNELHITATLDLTEISGKNAVPVEYRRGHSKRKTILNDNSDDRLDENPQLLAVEPWPGDLVQLGLQAILLEKAGYNVPKAVVYYASEKQRLDIEVNDGLKNMAKDFLEQAQKCSQGLRPQPLINDARCPKCSLQPLCLPDEVNYENNKMEGVSPRKIWPPRDDGIQVVTQLQCAKIGVSGMTLRISDREGNVVKEIPLANVESVTVVGHVQVTTQAIHAIADQGIPVAYISAGGRLISISEPAWQVSALVKKSQIEKLSNEKACLELAQNLITAKITNQRTLLMRNCADFPEIREKQLAGLVNKSNEAENIDSLRGFEGNAASIYFEDFAKMIKPAGISGEFEANGRQRRPPPDPVNAGLSLAYTLLSYECVTALRVAGLEPAVGAFHVPRPGRPAFALDLMEPFRPLIADSLILGLFNRGELTAGHFLRTSGGCSLTDSGRKAFFGAYARRMDTEVTHPVFGYKLSYRRMLVLHARMMAAWMAGEIPDTSFLTTR
jgi:CRISPR-associated protein Cas1